jgi:bifunctional enzyme CysN/CysC
MEDLIADDIDAYLLSHQHKTMLRFITCGSVDDGKSTLIGRLLYESKAVFDDQLSALATDSVKSGTQGDALDFALLVDGLAAEREQGITIDVAYRYFSTERRKFIVADTPGHEQYTRNMVTGASTADLAIILIDARHGLLTQTRRHSFLVKLLGVRSVVVAVNKLDAVGYSQARFDEIVADYATFAAEIGLTGITCIPMSALHGDNILTNSENTPWYDGLPLLEHLETVPVESDAHAGPFRLPVQWVNRPDLDFRGFSGLITSGSVKPGDRAQVLPGGQSSTVARIVTRDGDLDEAQAGQSVTLTLAEEIDVSRGQVLCAADDPCGLARRFEADVVWMSETPLNPNGRYLVKLAASTVAASIAAPQHRVDVNTMEHTPADTLALNEIGRCTVTLDRAVPFDPYDDDRDLGGFIVVDRLTNETAAAGLLRSATDAGSDVHWQALDVDREGRAALSGHRPAVVWLTGLSGAGKSTVANLLERQLHATGVRTYVLDGDNVRLGLNRDLGFTDADRTENVRRLGEVAALMADAGLVVIVGAISPFAADRAAARALVGDVEFIEVFIDAPLSVTEERDVKGLYSKARSGNTPEFTGITSPYESPSAPDIHIDSATLPAVEAAQQIATHLRALGIIS